MKRFTSALDMQRAVGISKALELATELKNNPWQFENLGKRRTLGLLFMNPSLRTRMSTQKAATLLGMDVMVLNAGSDSWTLETNHGVVMDGAATEHIAEAAAVMGRYCDVLGLRTFASLANKQADYEEQILENFIRYSGVPVVSLESAARHPLQSLADLITIEQYKSTNRPKVVLTWAPHPKALPQAVANSFAEWMQYADVEFVIAHPEGYELHADFVKGARVTSNQDQALQGADFVYAKNWSSFSTYGSVLSTNREWTITQEKMSRTNNAKFMHCLPIRRNMIATDNVLDSEQSIVLEQASNRVLSAQVVLYHMLQAL